MVNGDLYAGEVVPGSDGSPLEFSSTSVLSLTAYNNGMYSRDHEKTFPINSSFLKSLQELPL